tara:strand:- start:7754 stop:8716 length:963 start_codon:yes stop_codon:yes gene_type:complete
MISWIKSFLTHRKDKERRELYSHTSIIDKGRYFLVSALFIFISCQSDITVTSHQETAVVIDSVFQSEQIEDLDVLVVLDTSGSMRDNDEIVGTGIEIFRTDVESLTSQYQFGFITMDSDSLSYVGPYDSSSSSIDLILAPSLLSSTSGEAGFEATYIFLMSEDGIYFRRPDADFLLFLISDEEEQSSLSSQIFYEWLHEFFPDISHDVTVITTTPGGECSSEWGQGTGYKYVELANLYNKDAIDICDEDWEVWLAESSFLTQMISSIHLSQTPIQESIIVYIDNESIYGWSYDEESNVIHLDDTPNYGALIEVGYKVLIE